MSISRSENFITIIVCTYNRADLLNECLAALFDQTASQDFYEVLVVDNNSKDHTKQVVEQYMIDQNNLRYLLEKKQGLSHARNAGYLNTDVQWVGYMDDDGKPHRDYIEKSLEVIEDFDFDCFGGRYLPWYRSPKPKWISADFGKSKVLLHETGELKKGYNSGGIIFFKKEALIEIGGFSTKIGMNGNKIAYGEETLVQNKLRQHGLKIGYSPEIKMNHLVAEYKYNLTWHLKAAYAQGRDSVIIWNNNISNIRFHFFITKFLNLAFKNLEYLKRLRRKNYYLQNFLVDYISPLSKWTGVYKGSKLNKVKRKTK